MTSALQRRLRRDGTGGEGNGDAFSCGEPTLDQYLHQPSDPKRLPRYPVPLCGWDDRLLDVPGRTMVREALAPRHIVAMHVPPPEAADVARRLATSGMDAVLLTRPGMVVRDGVE